MFEQAIVTSSDGVKFATDVYGRSGSQVASAIRVLSSYASALPAAELDAHGDFVRVEHAPRAYDAPERRRPVLTVIRGGKE